MSLRDHFYPPVSKHSSWEGFHGFWPAAMVLKLADRLPAGYMAEPRVHLGSVVDAKIPDQYAYEVLIYDASRNRQLVAAVEIVSPANKDRPDSRQAFVAKCASFLQQGVCVSIIDLVTIRSFNLYAELLALLGQSDPTFGLIPPPMYAVTCRTRSKDRRTLLECWSNALALGQALPTLPIWLTEKDTVPLDLECSYEETCQALRIP